MGLEDPEEAGGDLRIQLTFRGPAGQSGKDLILPPTPIALYFA
jgi:hypothetical protein